MCVSVAIRHSAAVALAGHLITVTGASWDADELSQKEVYVYSPLSNKWDHIGVLPTPREICTAIEVSPLYAACSD